MTFLTLIRRSLHFHARSHLGVILGAAVGSAALIGALIVGDSVKGSLWDTALAKLGQVQVALVGGDRFFRAKLADAIQGDSTNRDSPRFTATSAIVFQGIVANADGSARANRVQIIGVNTNFWGLANHRAEFQEIEPGHVVLNHALAQQLGVATEGTVIVRIPKPSAIGRDFVVSTKSDATIVVRYTVQAIVSTEILGDFSLQPGQSSSLNAFVPMAELQSRLNMAGRANTMLMAGNLQGVNTRNVELQLPALASNRFNQNWRLTDAQVALQPITNQIGFELKTSRVFLDPAIARSALDAEVTARPTLTLLANLLQAGTNITPYSMITAAGSPWTPAGMQDDEILVSEWLVDDLQVKLGDTVALSYFDPASGAHLTERTNVFRVRGIVPSEMPWADQTLMPEFPGIEKAESTSDWDAGFPLVYKIRAKDEDYWKKYRGTPKAFITLAAGQKMWGNRFGNLTSIRFSIPTNDIAVEGYRNALEKKIMATIQSEEIGLRFEPVRERALQAVEQSQDFGGLFLGFSFFVIFASLLLMAMLFQFGLEQRLVEIGTLLALGFKPKQLRTLLLGEGMALAFLGGLIGVGGGIGYAWAMVQGLTTVWRDAVGTTGLHFHMTVQTLVMGLFASVLVGAGTIWLTLRKFVKRSARELLSGEIQPTVSLKRSRGGLYGISALILALGMVGWTFFKGDTANAEVFFSAGTLLLFSGLSFISRWLVKQSKHDVLPLTLGERGNSHPSDGKTGVVGDSGDSLPISKRSPDKCEDALTLGSLGLRGCARRRTRSLATVAMLGCGCFLIAAIGVFRLDANRDSVRRDSGTGGFALIGETTLPVVQDLNSQSGREFFALDEKDLAGVSFVPFRLHEGDEASCLNLNGAQRPRLLGVKPELLKARFSFVKAVGNDGWTQLRPPEGGTPTEIPAIADANSIQWSMHKQVGDTIDYVDERGQSFKVRIIGALANSILQGSLIIDEAEFTKRFPGESGYRTFLIDVPSNSVLQVSATLSRAMQDTGLELTLAARRLAQFNAVQNTYLGTFQVLGGLGLLLGSVGLGVVVLRNVFERRGELAVLQAVGYRTGMLQKLLLTEHGALLGLGLAIGLLAAGVAVMPSVLSPGAELPYRSVAFTLGAILVNGIVWTVVATRVALRGNLLAALRNE